MSLTQVGTWEVGVWETTVWANGVWVEITSSTATTTSTYPVEPFPINGVCDRCGFVYPNSQLRPDGQVTGSTVCKYCYDKKHPSDYLRARIESLKKWEHPNIYSDDAILYVDNENIQLISGTTSPSVIYNVALTASRIVLLSVSGAKEGDSFLISRTAGGNYILRITGIKDIPAGVNGTVVTTFNGTNWILTSYWTI